MQTFEHLSIKDRLILWLLMGETGISSETIAYAMSGVKVQDLQKEHICYKVKPYRWDVPYDPSDFRRCLKLLEYIPEWRERLPEVAEHFPEWKPFIENWDELEFLYEEEKQREDGEMPKLYARMKELRK